MIQAAEPISDEPVNLQVRQVCSELREMIHTAALETVTEIGGIVADELIQRLNTPYPPASRANEDPHRRTGNLSAGISHRAYELNDGVTVMIVSSRDGGDERIPEWLETGTTRGLEPRRYMQRTFEDWQERFEPEATRMLAEKLDGR